VALATICPRGPHPPEAVTIEMRKTTEARLVRTV
jgi:hypothetical protein